MNIAEKLEKIYYPPIKTLPTGEAKTIKSFWDGLIAKYLPSPEIVLKWHDVLLSYVKTTHPVFAIRGYNSAPKDRYGDLRRGFLTETSEYDFFYTDNFFAAYFQKMALDGFVPTLEELRGIFGERKFPSRFGINTSEERELLAIKQGKDPRINSRGFKVAHIIPVGMNYVQNSKIFGMQEVLHTYFPRGEREDYIKKTDSLGSYRARDFYPHEIAKKFVIAHFLRFVHPFNYFLCPKKTCEENNKCKEIAEYTHLLNYAHDYYLAVYGDRYKEFLDLIMPPDIYYKECFNPAYNDILVNYGLNLKQEEKTKGLLKKKDENTKTTVNNQYKNIDVPNVDVKLKMAFEYLNNPHTSFRKLEVKFLELDSPARGGGFVSKGIINSLGITAEMKGILQLKSLDEIIGDSTGILTDSLLKIKANIIR